MIQLCQFETPLGRVGVAERDGKVLAVSYGGRRALRKEQSALWELDEVSESGLGPSALKLQKYLNGGSRRLSVQADLGLVTSAFSRAVLSRLCRVPRGQTVFYGELAALVGSPLAARAVGSAMARNPIPIVVPCHRVLPQSGGIGNYTGGVDKKVWLLAREGVICD